MIPDDPRVVVQMIEKIDHDGAVGAQADVGALVNVADVDQNRISILPPPSPDLCHAARESTQVGISCVIARRQDVPMQIGCVQDRDPNCLSDRSAHRPRNVWRGVKQSGLPNRFKKCSASGGTHVFELSKSRQD